MTVIKNGTLQVPGANIYYEIRGSGPMLFLIHGGGGDADKFQHISLSMRFREFLTIH
ncbi:hypothetical protein GCM10011346_29300 [Oceanobacillus neutriphilus]|uniref:Alpha/beta hydrolase n=1 Tax=Oceanobacillus neutriphilus TaxID=531815 RepID=A0ABQ2NX02_9BACI|nr:hypothetical protein GCM10011346_29300 [Oceanobacillus neutriphilus]